MHHQREALIRLVDPVSQSKKSQSSALTGEGQRREPVPGRDPQHDAAVIRLAPDLGRQAAQAAAMISSGATVAPHAQHQRRPVSSASGRGGQPGT